MRRQFRFALVLTVGLAACSSGPPVYQRERFGVTSLHSRAYAESPSAACEAARRALLSQGYVVSQPMPDVVEGRKSFQEDAKTHVEIGFNVVCTGTGASGGSIAFVNALHDRYALKKSANSASVGVGVVGSVSLPLGASDDAMVKVTSETITAREFYERFFSLVDHYLDLDATATAASKAPPVR